MIFRCQPGYETCLEREIAPLALAMTDNGGGWIETNSELGTLNPELSAVCGGLCFAHSILLDPRPVAGETVNALAANIAGYFLESARAERFDAAWPLVFDCSAGYDGLGRRAAAVEKTFAELLRKRMSRVAKLASPALLPHVARQRGLFVFFTDFQKAFIAREIISGGQRRMADDPLAPSRSYLKIEEAYGILEREPAPHETVVDLGAAPGGWSYSAAKRGARVTAVDNGPLKAGALNNPLITHLQQDAFTFDPTSPTGNCKLETANSSPPADWLFCDLVEDPHHVLDNIVTPWLERRWCRRFIVNLKFGRTADPVALLRETRAHLPPALVREAHIRHLYHDREEFTLVGELAQPAQL